MLTARKGLFLVALVLLLCALLNARWTGWLTRPINRTVDTLQWPALQLSSLLKTDPESRDPYPQLTEDDVKQQLLEADTYNKQLWQENAKLKEQLEALKVIYLSQPIEAIRPVVAQVGQFNSDPMNPSMKLLRGSLQGVKLDDPVVYKSNLLGFVSELGPVTATVRLVTRPDYRTEVTIWPPGQLRAEKGWPVIGRAESKGDGVFHCDLKIKTAEYLQPGDLVRVSDPLRERANGFLLGAIERIEDHPNQPKLLRRLIVKPMAPIGPQREVTIITERID